MAFLGGGARVPSGCLSAATGARVGGPKGVGEFDWSEGVVDLASDSEPVLLRAGLVPRLVVVMLVGGVSIDCSGFAVLSLCDAFSRGDG